MREQQLGITLSIISHNSRNSGISVLNIVTLSRVEQFCYHSSQPNTHLFTVMKLCYFDTIKNNMIIDRD